MGETVPVRAWLASLGILSLAICLWSACTHLLPDREAENPGYLRSHISERLLLAGFRYSQTLKHPTRGQRCAVYCQIDHDHIGSIRVPVLLLVFH